MAEEMDFTKELEAAASTIGTPALTLDGEEGTQDMAPQGQPSYGQVPAAGSQPNAYGQTAAGSDGQQPSYGQTQPVYGQAPAAYGQPQGAYGQGPASYSQPQGAYGQTPAAYGQSQGAYGQTASAYGQSQGAYGQAASAYGQSQGAYGQAQAAYGQSQGAYGQTASAYGQAQASAAYAQAPASSYGSAAASLDVGQAPAMASFTAPDAAQAAQQAAKEMDTSILTPEEQAQVEAFADRIDLENITVIMQYGAGTQKKMASFSEQALANVRTQDLGEVGDMITNVVKELKNFDAEEEGKGGIFGFFKKQADKMETMKLNYDKADGNITRIAQNLEEHQVRLLKDSAMLDKMYEQNLAYYKELTMYILAGKRALAKVRATKLAELEARAQQTGLPEDAQAAKDLDDKCNRFEKKLHDLELTRMISIQTAPQIRLIQNNDTLMVEKIQTTLVNTIPLWKSQMVLALGIAHSTEAAKAQKEVTDVTNELLKKNAEKLHMASVETARESERGIVELETLKKTNADLINTLDEVLKIQREGRQKRQQAEAEMAQMEANLKNKLLEIQH